MSDHKLALSLLPDSVAICRMGKDAQIPDWALMGSFASVTRTPDELSIVCSQGAVPDGTKCEPGWRCLKVEGPLEFSAIGIIASLAAPLVQGGISIFVVSTYDTDYLMVKAENLGQAIRTLLGAGHTVSIGG